MASMWAPPPAGSVRPHCLVPVLKDTALSRGADPDGGQAVPGLSSVIEGKFVFTVQSPRRRAGQEKPGGRVAGTRGPPPGFHLRAETRPRANG